MKSFISILFCLLIFLRTSPLLSQQADNDSLELAQQYTEHGLKLVDEKKYSQAESLFKNALSIKEKKLGLDHL